MSNIGDLRAVRFVALAIACIGMFGSSAVRASAQFSITESQDQPAASQASPTPPQTQPPAPETKSEKKKKKKSESSGSFVIAPLPIVSPALGSGLVPIVGYITPIPAKDRLVEPSVLGVGGLITNNGSHAYVLAGDLYLDHGKYEVGSAYAHGTLDYNLYGVGLIAGNEGLKLPLEQAGHLFFAKALYRLPLDFYAGLRFIDGSSFITLKPSSGDTPAIPPDVGLNTNLRALGIEASRDSRPNRFYPLKGSVILFTGDFFAQNLGSKYSFQSYNFTFNKYWSIKDSQVIAYNLFWCGTGGTPPFYGNCIYGSKNELRGYTAGRYLDRFMFATQGEYRLSLPWRFGVVGFGGLGSVTPGEGQALRIHQFLPAGGVGVRYVLAKQYHVNLRTDFAWGKNNFTWGLGVGEAF